MKNSIFFIFVLLFFYTYSQNDLKFLSATDGAACQEVLYSNNYLFVGAGSTLIIYKTSDTIPYKDVFRYRLVSIITDMKIYNDVLYVAANHDGIVKLDISNPETPQILWHYVPDDLSIAVYDISKKGQDTLILAAKNKIVLLKDSGNDFSFITTFGELSWGGIIRGGDIKGNIYAYAVGMSSFNAEDGVHFYNLSTLTEEKFYKITFGDPEDVIFDKNDVLHVLGGSQSTTNPLSFYGVYYALDVSDINNINMIFSDTIDGNAFSIADAINGIILNDTLYIATIGGLDLSDITHANLFVYDVRDKNNISFIGYVNAGLWHFDVDADSVRRKLFIASEWYGIKTINLKNFYNYEDAGNTLTGGWNTGSDAEANYLAVANEGYGFKLFDISDPYNPQLIGENNDSGFCNHILISKAGDYIFGFYTSGDGFRVFDINSLEQVASLAENHNYKRLKKYENYLICAYSDLNQNIIIFDVSQPQNPYVVDEIQQNFNDIDVNEDGFLFVSYDNKIKVFDVKNGFSEVSTVSSGESANIAGALTVAEDTVWCYFKDLGLKKFFFQNNNLTEIQTYQLTLDQQPDFLANDKFGIYAVYKTAGLYAFSKSSLTQQGYYVTGLEYWKNQFGVQDLFCKNELIFLVEYHSQTSILTSKNITKKNYSPTKYIKIYPNPIKDFVSIETNQPFNFILTAINGNLLLEGKTNSHKSYLDLKGLEGGIYILKFSNGQWFKIYKLP